jgi:hypothetical protein
MRRNILETGINGKGFPFTLGRLAMERRDYSSLPDLLG